MVEMRGETEIGVNENTRGYTRQKSRSTMGIEGRRSYIEVTEEGKIERGRLDGVIARVRA